MSDYLWDGSGAPDPEIERLESVLRPLRYAPPAEPLRLPVEVAVELKRKPAIWSWALAAAVVFMALALGLWVILQRPAQSIALSSPGSMGNAELGWTIPDRPVALAPDHEGPRAADSAPRRHVVQSFRAEQAAARNRAEQREGRLAAEQLLKALRITSDQLNFVKNKVSSDGAPDPVS